MKDSFLFVSSLKGFLAYQTQFKIGAFFVSSIGLSFGGVDFNITDIIPIAGNSLPNLSLDNLPFVPSLPGLQGPLIDSPIAATAAHVPHIWPIQTFFNLNVNSLAFKFIVGCGLLGVIGLVYGVMSIFTMGLYFIFNTINNTIIPYIINRPSSKSYPFNNNNRINKGKVWKNHIYANKLLNYLKKDGHNITDKRGNGGGGPPDKNIKDDLEFHARANLIEYLLNLLYQLNRIALTIGNANPRADGSILVQNQSISFNVDAYINRLLFLLPYVDHSHPHYGDEYGIIREFLELIRRMPEFNTNINRGDPNLYSVYTLFQWNIGLNRINAAIQAIIRILQFIHPNFNIIELDDNRQNNNSGNDEDNNGQGNSDNNAEGNTGNTDNIGNTGNSNTNN